MNENIKIEISEFMSISNIKQEVQSSDEEDSTPVINQSSSFSVPLKIKAETFKAPLKKGRKYRGVQADVVRTLLRTDIIGFCQQYGLIASSVKCHCGHPMTLTYRSEISDGAVWSCRKKSHGGHKVTVTVRKGTWFEQSRLTIFDILWIAYMWVYQYSHIAMLHECDNSTQTIAEWSSYCRDVCRAILECKCDQVGGAEKLVEIFEGKFSSKKKVGKKDEKKPSSSQWVFCAIEQFSTNSVLNIVKDKTSETLVKLFDKCILPGTTVFSNIWSTYDNLSRKDFIYLTTERSISFFDSVTQSDIDTVEDLWEMANRPPPGANRYNKFEFNSHFCEFMYRKSLAFAPDAYFEFLKDIAKVYIPCGQISKNNTSNKD